MNPKDMKQPVKPSTEDAEKRSVRRPYRRPEVISRPLFERMALACYDKDFELDMS